MTRTEFVERAKLVGLDEIYISECIATANEHESFGIKYPYELSLKYGSPPEITSYPPKHPT